MKPEIKKVSEEFLIKIQEVCFYEEDTSQTYFGLFSFVFLFLKFLLMWFCLIPDQSILLGGQFHITSFR